MRENDKKQIIPEGYYSIDEMCQLLNLKKALLTLLELQEGINCHLKLK